MATSQGVNVLRWSALAFGVSYGVYHQSAIYCRDRQAEADAKYRHQEALIQKARAEFAKRNPPRVFTGLVTDPEDKRFDLEKYLLANAAEN